MYYGMSSNIGKTQIKQFLIEYLKPNAKICDMGAGGGTYQKLLGSEYNWTAVEIWHESAEYIKQFYNKVYEEDVRTFNYPEKYDLVIFGDIIEHLTVEDAQQVLNKAEQNSNAILIAVPYMYPQKEIFGNKAEKHIQDDLTPELFNQRYPGFELIYSHNNYAYYWKEIKKIDISIIIPCHNLEKYIKPLLLSFQALNLKDINAEFIFILDNCTDNTEQIIISEKRELDFKIIKCVAGAPGLARNVGLNNAQGEYIWFVDGDDWIINPEILQQALSYLREKQCNMIQLTFVSNFFNKQHYSMVWQYIFKHKFITDIRFNNKQNHEDNDFSKIAITLNKNDIPLLKVPSYFYNYGRPDSQTMKLKKPEISVVEI